MVGEERRKVVINEAPANIDCATGTPIYSKTTINQLQNVIISAVIGSNVGKLR